MARADFGVIAKASLKTFAPNDTYPTSAQFMQDVFVNGDGAGAISNYGGP